MLIYNAFEITAYSIKNEKSNTWIGSFHISKNNELIEKSSCGEAMETQEQAYRLAIEYAKIYIHNILI